MGGLEANELLGYDLILTGYTSSLDVGRETEAAVKRVLAASSQGNKHPISSCSLAYIQYPRIYCPITTLSKPPPPTHTPPHPTPPHPSLNTSIIRFPSHVCPRSSVGR